MSTFDPFEPMNEESEAMRNFRPQICAALSLAATSSLALAQAPSSPAVPVTVDNYVRAQSDIYFGQTVKAGAFGKFLHGRELAPIDRRLIIRPNRDTLYSLAVFDFDAGPVTVMLPDAGKRFMVMQVTNEDQYTRAVYYGAWVHDTSATPARVLSRWDNVMASSALRSALRSTACMQAVDLKTKFHLRSTGRRRRSVGKCGAIPGPLRSGRGGTSLSGLSDWPSAGAGGVAP